MSRESKGCPRFMCQPVSIPLKSTSQPRPHSQHHSQFTLPRKPWATNGRRIYLQHFCRSPVAAQAASQPACLQPSATSRQAQLYFRIGPDGCRAPAKGGGHLFHRGRLAHWALPTATGTSGLSPACLAKQRGRKANKNERQIEEIPSETPSNTLP